MVFEFSACGEFGGAAGEYSRFVIRWECLRAGVQLPVAACAPAPIRAVGEAHLRADAIMTIVR